MPIGPFIVIVGPTLQEISASYLCIDENIRFETSSCIHAVELSVKTVKSLGKKYAHVSSHVCEVIEIVLFEFTCDHPSNAVNNLVKKIRPPQLELNSNII